jgi:uncharacterized membrane protein
MIESIGWFSTILVLIGYVLNAKSYTRPAMIAWIVGDIGWISYDIFIYNYSHLALSAIIITINLYGIWNSLSQTKKYKTKY